MGGGQKADLPSSSQITPVSYIPTWPLGRLKTLGSSAPPPPTRSGGSSLARCDILVHHRSIEEHIAAHALFASSSALPKALLPLQRRRRAGQRTRAGRHRRARRRTPPHRRAKTDEMLGKRPTTPAWAALQEDAEGRLQARSAQQETKKRKRQQAPGGVARGLIRYVALVVDASEAAKEPDPRPSRLKTACDALATFCGDLLAANPLGACCVVAARDGGAKVASDPSSARRSHADALTAISKAQPKGPLSLAVALSRALDALIERPGTRAAGDCRRGVESGDARRGAGSRSRGGSVAALRVSLARGSSRGGAVRP